eukprot:gene8150-1403_t
MSAAAGHICIPVMESSEVVVVDINKGLPDEPEDLLEILAAEAAPLSTWYDFARAYLAQGKEASFIHICQEGTRDEVIGEVERFFGKKPTYELIQFHCALAALYMGKGKEEKDRAKKADWFNKATTCLTSAKTLDPNEQLVRLSLGQLALAKGDTAVAKQEFSRAMLLLNNGRPNIAATLATAGLLYKKEQLKEALALYRRALKEHPSCPAEVRLGIAVCCFRMGKMTSAQAAYERVLQLDPECADALLGLAAIKFNSQPNVQQGMADGLALLTRAYEINPTHVGTLNLLAHYCLLKGQYDKVLLLSRSALELAESDNLRADCLLQQARAYHALGSYNEAMQHYSSASRLDPSLALPHMGLAQMYLARGLDEGTSINASSELESALKAAPVFYDALKIHLCLHSLDESTSNNSSSELESALKAAAVFYAALTYVIQLASFVFYSLDESTSTKALFELGIALKAAPVFYAALTILGQLIYDHPAKIEKTITHFKDAAHRQVEDSDIWELLAELVSEGIRAWSRHPPTHAGSLKAYEHGLGIHRRKQAEVARKREDAIAKRRERIASAAEKKVSAKDDLFGSDDDAEDEDPEVAAAAEAVAAAAIPEHKVPSRLLNNAAVLFYRCVLSRSCPGASAVAGAGSWKWGSGVGAGPGESGAGTGAVVIPGSSKWGASAGATAANDGSGAAGRTPEAIALMTKADASVRTKAETASAGRTPEAIALMTQANASVPAEAETASAGRTPEAIALMTQANASVPAEAEIASAGRTPEAIALMTQANASVPGEAETASMEGSANLAQTGCRAGRTPEAIALMTEANASVRAEAETASLEGSAATSAADLRRLTLGYNNARLQEASGNYTSARDVYEAILEMHPGYIDCYLRLSCIARRTGALGEALSWAQRALNLQGGHSDALALMSQLYMDRREWKLANDMIKRLLEDRNNAKDSYGHLAYGNLNMAMAPSDRRKDADSKKAEERLVKAMDEYSKVLRAEPSNVFAANGLGAVMAEMGRLEEARDIFTDVQVLSSGGVVAELGGCEEARDILIDVQVSCVPLYLGGLGCPVLHSSVILGFWVLGSGGVVAGGVVIEMGRLEEARDIFTDVHVACVDCGFLPQGAVASGGGFLHIPDVYINLANVALAREEYTTAVGLYQVAMDKLDMSKQCMVLLYLARAHYDGGDLRAAKQHLLRCIHVAPTDYKIRFNVALTMQEWAVRLYRKNRPSNDSTKLQEYRQAQGELKEALKKNRPSNDPTKLQEYRQAQGELKEALKIFEHLQVKGHEATSIDAVKLKAHVTFCKDQVKKAEIHIQAAEDEYNTLASKREAQEKIRQIAEVKRSIEELKKKDETRRIDAEKQRLAGDALEKTERIEAEKQRLAGDALEKAERVKEAWRTSRIDMSMPEEGKDKKKKGKGKKGKQDDGFLADEEEEERSEEEGGGGDPTEKAVDALFGGDSGDEEAKEDLMARAGLNSDTEDEGGDKGEPSASQPSKRRKLKRGAEVAKEEKPASGDELEDDDGEAGANDLLDDDEEAEPAQAKRVRRTALDDSDSEGEGGKASDADMEDADDGAADGADATEKNVDALFDDDDDDE